ncbi:MAG: GHMP kinase [Acidobacteria bacterium]|nr:GHMP kinase [Acidobacteriota bacterium]
MIVSKTPFRMSFVGGGTDLPGFYRAEMGAVVSTSIDKYMYIAVNRKFDERIRISYSRTEEVETPQQIEHPLVRHALDVAGIDGGVEIASMADIPSRGTGLGSSSAYTVGLLNALFAYRNQYASKETLARLACDIEIARCGEPIGKQDQYAAAYGGLNLIRFHPDDSVSVDPVICRPEVLAAFEASLLVFYTGRLRSAATVLSEQAGNMTANRPLLQRMVQLALDFKRELESGCLDAVGPILDENWRLKRQMADGISDGQIDEWYETGLAGGALGGKLLGAGRGGFLMFVAPPDRHVRLRRTLADLKPVTFRFDRTGAQIVFYQPMDIP